MPARRPAMRRLIVILLALGAFGAALITWAYVRSSPTLSADEAIVRSAAALKAHNASDARDLAMQAVRGAQNNPRAHLILAEAMLALDDGVGAQAEIQRATETGINSTQVQHLRAHAWLLQGDSHKAVAEAARAASDARPYAVRIRARALAADGKWAEAEDTFGEAARLAPRDPDVWVDFSRFRLTAGNMVGASAAAQRGLQLDPGHLKGLLLRGELVRSQYGLVAALPWFEAALKRDPRDHAALIEYAATLGEAGRTIDALAATRRALIVRANSPQALYLQSVIAARAGNADLARTLVARTGGTLDRLPGMQLLTGALDIQTADYEQAIAKLKALVDGQPMNIVARRLLAGAMLRRSSAPAALDMLQPIAGRSDADSYTLLLAARAQERLGDHDIAGEQIDRSAQPSSTHAAAFTDADSLQTLAAEADQSPDTPGTLVRLLRGLYSTGEVPAALFRAQQTASRNQGVPAAQLLFGDALMLAKRPADAVIAYRRAADQRFDRPTMLRMVEALGELRRAREATNVLALFLSQNPQDVVALRLSARAQLAASEYEAAIDSMEHIRSQIGDGDAALNADLARAYAGAGSLNTALEFAEAGYALAPANPDVADAFGWALYQSGDLPHAAEMMHKAARLAPSHPQVRWHLAQINAAMQKERHAPR